MLNILYTCLLYLLRAIRLVLFAYKEAGIIGKLNKSGPDGQS